MSLYTIADLHLSLGTDKPMDIFAGWQNYVDKIVENWNYFITDEDTVVIAGDISWAMKLEECYEDFKFLNSLPGTKIILKGNHDYWFSTKAKVDNYLEENGFNTIKMLFNNSFEYGDYLICGTRGWINEPGEKVDKTIINREAGRLTLSIESGIASGKEPIVFLHYPPVYAQTYCTEILDVLYKYNVKRCFYGHLHGASCKNSVNGLKDGIEYQLVSCDFTQFNPVKVL
ncbi:MAG: metallophosphoesterase [Oscillospiraceae bacterium]|nr:metallophosphoesterase [Oscillospiraceae bacterium]